MADTGDGLDPLVLDTVVRAQAPTALLGALAACGLPLLTLLGAPSGSWLPAVAALGALLGTARWLVARSIRTDRDLATVLDEP